jgi:NAD+ diphosphatase
MYNDFSPGFKFCPKCSSNTFISKDNGHSFGCERCHFNYFINNSAAVACLITNNLGELLLTRRALEPNQGMLDLPGGFVEPLESAEMAARREIREELNLNVVKLKYLISYPNLYHYSGINIPTIDLAFVCEVESFQFLEAADDVASIEFYHPEKIDFKALCAVSMEKIIRFYQDWSKQ